MALTRLAAALAAVAISLAAAGPALACSKDDTSYFDGFLDTSCLETPLTNTVLDTFGGLRLTTDGARSATTWTSDADFGATGVTYQGKPFTHVGAGSLAVSGTNQAASLTLPTTGMPLLRDGNGAEVAPTSSAAADNDNISDPSVVKTAAGSYVMYYSATAENGAGPALFRATSPDGKVWTKQGAITFTNAPAAGDFDARGQSGPDVIFDASATPKFKMYYSGQGDVFGGIGLATSNDGSSWTRVDGDSGTAAIDAVVAHGRAGSPDSFAAEDPSVLLDGTTWKMWYTGDDSNRKRVAFATSPDGSTWQKGGKVISPEDGVNANLSEGAFAPTVWKDGSGYNMILTGRKISGGGGSCPSAFQTKLINASSSDGISWTIGSNALNPGGTVSKFDCSNVDAGDVLLDPDAPQGEQQKLYYSGNTVDANGNAHDQIGLAMASGGAFGRYTSPSPGTSTDNSIISLSAFGAAFDAQTASGLGVVKTTMGFAGFYSGNRYSDFKPRLGDATSSDGSTWTKETTGADATTHAILPLSGGSQFDSGGQSDPSALYIENTGASQPDYFLYFTGLSNSGARTIGYADAQETAGTLVPDNSTWAHKAQISITAGSFDANGMGDPYPLDDTGTSGKFVLYYTGTSASGATTIGCITAAAVTFASPTRCNSGNALILPTAGSFDQDGIKDPVVQKIGSTYFLFYTAVEKITDPGGRTRTIERIGYATSASAASGFLKQGLLIDPSDQAYAFDENGVEPSGITVNSGTNAIDFYYAGVDRSGRKSAGHATGDTTVTTGTIENGSATYQLGDPTTTVEDWRDIAAVSNGSTEIWVSFLQPYSASATQFWSDFFPIDAANKTANLNFLLTVKGVRWQVREKTPSGNPSLDSLTIGYAPIHFSPTGDAMTKAITPPATDKLLQWRTLTVSAKQFDPTKSGGSSSGTIHVFDASDSTDLVPSQALPANGDASVNLTSISATDHPALRVRIDMSSGGAVSPFVSAMKVLYYTDKAPPPTPVITLTATPTTVSSGQNVTLSGSVTVGGTPLVSQAVALLSQPTGGSGFAQFTTVTTDSSGAFTTTANPTASTDYEASYAGTNSSPVTVTVNPPVLTMAATPAQVIFGQPVTLSGNLSSGAPLAATAVSLLQQPAGAAALAPFGSATTDAAGNWSSVVMPQSNTSYQANSANVTAPPTANVGVHQKITLKATRKLGTGTFKGTIAPAHPGREVVIQLRKGTSFVTFVKTKTGATSAFSVKKALKPCGKFQFRAVTAADADHLDGTSVVALVEKHRVTLTVKVKGRKATLSGKVAPAHRSGTVLIKEIKGTRAVKLGKAKLGKKSTFKLVLKVKKGKHTLRADMASDKCHFAGSSALRKITVR